MPLTTIGGSQIQIGSIPEDRLINPYVNISGDTMTGVLNLTDNGLRIGTNQFWVIDDKIGIGTQFPNYTLDVAGTINADTIISNSFSLNQISLSSGSVSSPTLSFSSDPTTGIFSSSLSTISFTSSGSTAITVDSTQFTNYTNKYSYIRNGISEYGMYYDDASNTLNIGSGSSYLSINSNNNFQRIFLSDDGKIGIATNTLDADSILSIFGRTYSSDGYKGLKITDLPGVLRNPAPGELLIGNNTNLWSLGTLQAGTGISIQNLNGSIVIHNTGTGGTGTGVSAGVSTITGTINQIIVSSPDGDVELSLPQNIATNSDVSFNSVTGSFIGSGAGLTNIPVYGLQSSTITVNTVNGIDGGGTISLGDSLTLSNTGLTSVYGTTNQINVSGNTGSVTFSLPQDINTISSPTFNSLTLTNPLSVVSGGTGLSTIGSTSTVLTSVGSGASWAIIPGEVALRRYYVTKNGSDSNDGLSIKYAFASIKYALEQAELSEIPCAIYVSSGDYELDNSSGPVTIPENCSLIGDSVRQTTIRPSTPGNGLFYFESGIYLANFVFRDKVLQDGSYDGTWTWVGQFKPNALIKKSPYVQNCSIISGTTPDGLVNGPGGSGLLADGDVLDPNTVLKSMVANAFTIISNGGVGYQLENDAYMQLVSVFIIFCDKAIYCKSGSYVSVSNSAFNFGNYGLYSEGFSSVPLPNDIGVVRGTGAEYDTATERTASYIRATGLGRYTDREQLNYIVKFYGSGGTDVTGTYVDGYGSGNSNQIFIDRVDVVGAGSSSFDYKYFFNTTLSTGSSLPTDGSITVKFFRPSIINGSNCTWEYVGNGTDYNAFPGRNPVQLTGAQKNSREQYYYVTAVDRGETGKTGSNYGRIYASGTNEFGDFKLGKLVLVNSRDSSLSLKGNISLERVVSLKFTSGPNAVDRISTDPNLGGAGRSDRSIPTEKAVYDFVVNNLGSLFNKRPTTNSGSSVSDGNYLVQLNSSGKIDINQIPALPLYNTFGVGSTSERYNLSATNPTIKTGDLVLQSGAGTSEISNWIVKDIPTYRINATLEFLSGSGSSGYSFTQVGTANTGYIQSITGSGVTYTAVVDIVGGYFGTGVTVEIVSGPPGVALITDITDNFQRLDTNTSTIDASGIVSGTISSTRLGSGVANSDTFLSGASTYLPVVQSLKVESTSGNPIKLGSTLTSGTGNTLYYRDVAIDIARVSTFNLPQGSTFSNVGVARFNISDFDVTSNEFNGDVSLKIVPRSKGGLGGNYATSEGLVRFRTNGEVQFVVMPDGDLVGTTTSQTILNKLFGSGNTWNGNVISLQYGGTGATSQATAANNILPSQSTNSGKYLTTNGSNVSWSYPITSISAGNGITVSSQVGGGVTVSFDTSATLSVVNVNQSTITTSDVTGTGTSQVVLDTFSSTTYRTAKYIIQVRSTGSGTTLFQSSEILLIHDGTNVYQTQYANILSGGTTLGVFDSDISGGNVRLLLTPTYSGNKIRVYRTSIKSFD